jgi:hypothetical protein
MRARNSGGMLLPRSTSQPTVASGHAVAACALHRSAAQFRAQRRWAAGQDWLRTSAGRGKPAGRGSDITR